MGDVLLVEDDVPLAHALLVLLRRKGLRVTAVETSEEAIAAVTSQRFSVVLLDLILREFSSGYYVIDAIRKSDSSQRPYVIVMTAASLTATSNLDRSIVKAIFVKPIELDVVSACVRAAVVERQNSAVESPGPDAPTQTSSDHRG
jgi:DNA-binding response OmpR family regulator